MWFRYSGRTTFRRLALLLVLMLMSTFMFSAPAEAVDGGLTVTLTEPGSTVTTSDTLQVYNQVSDTVDPNNVYFCWEFGNGLDKVLAADLQKITLKNADTNQEVTLNKTGDFTVQDIMNVGDFRWSKENTTPKLRTLELILSSTALQSSTNYIIEIAADFTANNGNTLGKKYSWVFTTAAGDLAVPTWPESSLLTGSNILPDRLTLTWPIASDNLGIKNYRVYQDSVLLGTVDKDTTSYAVSGLNADTAYNFKIEAGDAAGNWTTNGPGASIKTMASDTTAPTWSAAATLVVANIASSSLDLNWPAAQDNIGVVGYKIYQGGSLIGSVDNAARSYHVSGLISATGYNFTVKAIDAAGNLSDALDLTVSTLSGSSDTQAPTWPDLTASTSEAGYPYGSNGNATNTEITFTFHKAADNVGVVGYRVYKDGVLIATLDAYTFIYTELLPLDNKNYIYKIEAGDAAGNWSTDGPQRSVKTLTLGDWTAPTWPAGTSVTASNITQDSFDLNWTPAQDNLGIRNYVVQAWLNGEVQFYETSDRNLLPLADDPPCTSYTVNSSSFQPGLGNPHPGLAGPE